MDELLIPEVFQQRALELQIDEDFVNTVPFSEEQDILPQIHEERILSNALNLQSILVSHFNIVDLLHLAHHHLIRRDFDAHAP